MTDELDDPYLPTELFGFEGSLFDLKEMERLRAAYMQGCWFWHDDYLSYLYRDPQIGKAAPIAESGREIIEQAKEEAFFAWGL
jgi:hypothetical protein